MPDSQVCSECGYLNTHAASCTSVRARVFWLTAARDLELDELDDWYRPQLTVLREEWREARERVYAAFDRKARELKAAA